MTKPRAISDRELPNNLEAEKAVIGALLIDNRSADQLPKGFQPGQCFRAVHRQILAACLEILVSGQPLDLVSLKETLAKRGELEDVGGPAYIASMVDGVPRSTNIRAYAEIVQEKATLRRLIVLGGKLTDKGYANDAEARAVIAETEIALADIAAGAQMAVGAVPLADDLSALMADLDYRVQHRGQISGLPTGFPEVDLLTHGWQKRQMVVIAGQTSFGKSVLALNTALAMASAGHRVVYYSYEMSRQELQQRLWSAMTEIPLTRILWGNLSSADYAKLSAAMDTMHGLPLEINDGSSRSVADARAECRQIKADRGLAAVFFDHFQLMEGVDGENRTQQLGGVSRAIQKLGVELDVVTVTMSQLTLSGEEATKEPQLGQTRECKQLEHDSNVYAMLHPYHMKDIRTETAAVPMKVLFRKNRGGRLGRIPLMLERDYVRFVPMEEPRPEPRKPKAEKTPEPAERAIAY